jgi:hypothetical protein
MSSQDVIHGLTDHAPVLIGWLGAAIAANAVLKCNKGKAERFFAAGASLMLVDTLMAVFTVGIVMELQKAGIITGTAISRVLLLRGLIALAGIICLVYAFWTKFRVKPND